MAKKNDTLDNVNKCYVLYRNVKNIRGCAMGDFLTAKELAEAAGVHIITVLRWLKDGKIEGKKFGKSWRIHKDELKKILPSGDEGKLE